MAMVEKNKKKHGEQAAESDARVRLEIPEMRYQEQYVWLIFVSSLDIMLTWQILRSGGEEVNPVARLVIEGWGLGGAVLFKFALMLFVIISCEVIGRQKDRLARNLIYFAIAVSAFPPVWSFILMFMEGLAPVSGN
jgi:hypothetical protein